MDLWFAYQDTGGVRQKAVYSLLYKYWRFVDFPASVASGVYSDETVNVASGEGPNRLLLGSTAGAITSHEGFSDLGAPITAALRTGAWTFGSDRVPKLLGDLVLDLLLTGGSATLTPSAEAETIAYPPVAIVPNALRRLAILQPFVPAPQQARSIGFDLSVVAPTDATPELFYGGISVVPFPELGTTRLLTWGTWGSLSDKYLKGILFEIDTFGQPIVVQVEADGVVVQTLTLQTSRRAVQNLTFPQVLGREFRVTPTTDLPSQVYTILPIFDEEPYALARWETQLLDFNLPGAGWGHVLSADLCYRSTAAATLTLTAYTATGTLLSTLTKPLPSTSGAKQKRYFPFPANKGVLYKFVFQVDAGTPTLTLYQEESRLRVQQWAGQEIHLKTFGNDDTDATRNMSNAVISAERAGGGS
jgi:hypothetical protein